MRRLSSRQSCGSRHICAFEGLIYLYDRVVWAVCCDRTMLEFFVLRVAESDRLCMVCPVSIESLAIYRNVLSDALVICLHRPALIDLDTARM